MASRNSTRSTSARASQEPETAAVQEAAGLVSRQQLTLLTRTAAAMCRSAAAFQEAQLGVLQRSGALYQELAGRIEQATGPGDLLSIQSSLMMSSWQQALQFSQDLMRLGTTVQSEMQAPAGAPPEVASGAADAVAPMVQAWQSFFTPPANGAARARAH